MEDPNHYEEDHVYLDVIHVPDLPLPRPSTSTLCGSTVALRGQSERDQEVARTGRRLSAFNAILILTIVVLSVLCGVFIALYIKNAGEETTAHDTQDSLDNNIASDKDSTDCNTNSIRSVSSAAEVTDRDCAVIDKEQPSNHNKTGNKCTTESMVFHRQNTTDYVKIYGAPSMTAITVCFWIRLNRTREQVQYLSYVGRNGEDGFHIGEPELPRRNLSARLDTMDGKWHSVCWTWSNRGGRFTLYKDGRIAQQGSFKNGQTISGGGTWILGRNTVHTGKAERRRSKRTVEKKSEMSQERQSEMSEQKSEKAEQESERKSEISERMAETREREKERKSEKPAQKSKEKLEPKLPEKLPEKSEKLPGKSEKLPEKSEKLDGKSGSSKERKTSAPINVTKLIQGEIAGINIWDKVLPKKELLEILRNCPSKYKGNIKSWEDFKVSGMENIKVFKDPTCCKL